MSRPLQWVIASQDGLDLAHLHQILRANGYEVEQNPPGFPSNYWIIHESTRHTSSGEA